MGSHFLSHHPSSHRHFCGLHCNPAGPASSGVWEGWASTSLLPPPDSLTATGLPWQPPSPLQRGQCAPCPSAQPPEGSSSEWDLREEWAQGKRAPPVSEGTILASSRTEAPCEEVVGHGNKVSPASSNLGPVLSLFLKPLKCKTCFALFSTFFFLLRFFFFCLF